MNIFSLFRSQPDHTTSPSRVNPGHRQNQDTTATPDEDCVIIAGVMLDRKKDAELISDFMIWSAPMM